jgi:hypothetical protein
MSVGSVSNSGNINILSDEYLLEQQKKLRQKQQQSNSEAGADAAKVEKTQSGGAAGTQVNTGSSVVNSSAPSSGLSVQASSAGTEAASSSETSDSSASSQALISKANSGAELSASELQALKQADPSLYARVVRAQKAREEVRAQIGENPSNAVQITQDAIARNVSGDENTRILTNRAIFNEYKNFASKNDQVIISSR